jgi:hypothetical protein
MKFSLSDSHLLLPTAYCLLLFLMTHGYPRDNPPKNIPDRHRDDLNFGNPGLFRSMKGNFM